MYFDLNMLNATYLSISEIASWVEITKSTPLVYLREDCEIVRYLKKKHNVRLMNIHADTNNPEYCYIKFSTIEYFHSKNEKFSISETIRTEFTNTFEELGIFFKEEIDNKHVVAYINANTELSYIEWLEENTILKPMVQDKTTSWKKIIIP